MRARYYRGEHEGKSWGGPWATATITVAGEPAETPTPEPVKEEPVQQPPRDAPDPPAGTIDTLTAADETGQLLLTWDSPSGSKRRPHGLPRELGRRARRITPSDTASAGNDHPTTTTHTLVGPRLRHRLQRQGHGHATRTARTPPAHGTDPGPRQPPRSSFSRCRHDGHHGRQPR